MTGDKPRINGNQYEWASLYAKLDGVYYYGLTAVKFSEKRERTKAYGQGKDHAPRGRTRGKYSAEGSMEMWKSSFKELRDALAAKAGSGNYGDQEFDVVIQYSESDEPAITEVLHQCVIAGVDTDHSEGTDPLKEAITLDVMYITKDGQTLFTNDGTR